jgi:hypothetical protein
MKKITEKEIEKESHSYSIMVYETIAWVKVILPMDLYSEIVSSVGYGAWDKERFLISKFVKNLFVDEFKGLKLFTNKDEFYKYLTQKGLDIENDDNNDWFKSAVFELANFDKDLENVVKYINQQSSKFELNTKGGKTKIAEKLLEKLK